MGQIALFVVGMAAVTPVDAEWTIILSINRNPGYTDWMRRTLFEGDLPGATDFSILIFLLIIGAYIWSVRRSASALLRRWRPALGYVLVSSLVSGLMVVHSLKWVLGRARPDLVLKQTGLTFSEWYQIGPHYIGQGLYSGSFPSGHTASIFVLMSIAYVFAADPLLHPRWKALGWLLGLLVLVDAAAMTVANSMARSHWISDGVGSVLLLWPLIHALYFWVLRVPERRLALHRRGRYENPKQRPLEAWLCLYGALAVLGVVLVLLGLRAPWEPSSIYFLGLIVPGCGLAAVFWPRLLKVLREIRKSGGGPARSAP